jgi:hypothetical protein
VSTPFGLPAAGVVAADTCIGPVKMKIGDEITINTITSAKLNLSPELVEGSFSVKGYGLF